MVRSGLLGDALVTMPMRVEIARRVTWMIVVLSRYFLYGFVAMPMLVHVARLMAWMIVMRSWFLPRHVFAPKS